MAKQQKFQPKKPLPVKSKTTKATAQAGVLQRLDERFEKNEKKIFYGLLFLSTVFSFLLFDSKVSTGGDDSAYIERAWQLIHDGIFPYYQGPGYPVFLSLFVKLFGLNVIVLKLSSVLCQFGFVWFTYKAFRKRIPYTVLFALLAFISFNSFFQYYASQTYTETFFLFIQSICLYVMFRIIDSIKTEPGFLSGLKQDYLKWLLFGFMFLLLSISKSIAFVSIGAVVIYFLLNKNYKQILYALIAFAVFRIIYQLGTAAAFGPNGSGQLELLLRKDLYKPELGHEDFSGMITRFMSNFKLYFSLHMYRILNLRPADAIKVYPGLSFLSGIALAVFTLLSYRKNKFVFFAGIYMLVLCGGVFFAIQANNMQDRLIMIAMPLVFLVLLYGMYELARRSGGLQYIVLLFSSIMLLITIGKSAIQAKENTTALSRNLGGDIYYGYTPDWVNFLQMSRYCADSLPQNTEIISRKPEMSFIYGKGRKFIGQYWVPTMNPDSILMGWQQQKIKYVIMPNLRMEPKKNNGRIINTIQRMLQPIEMKYPQKLKLLKTIGTEEQAYLYEINY